VGLVPTASEGTGNIPADEASVNGKPERNCRSETQNSQALANQTAQDWRCFKLDLLEFVEPGHALS
jgi:hypothetical protein